MKISVTDREGNKHELEGDTNSTLMEILRDAGLDIEASCGGCCACATCHVYIDKKWLSKINPINEDRIEVYIMFGSISCMSYVVIFLS